MRRAGGGSREEQGQGPGASRTSSQERDAVDGLMRLREQPGRHVVKIHTWDEEAVQGGVRHTFLVQWSTGEDAWVPESVVPEDMRGDFFRQVRETREKTLQDRHERREARARRQQAWHALTDRERHDRAQQRDDRHQRRANPLAHLTEQQTSRVEDLHTSANSILDDLTR